MSIGTQIKAWRNAEEWTADRLAREVGRDRQSVYMWESDRVKPSGDALQKLVGLGAITREQALEILGFAA